MPPPTNAMAKLQSVGGSLRLERCKMSHLCGIFDQFEKDGDGMVAPETLAKHLGVTVEEAIALIRADANNQDGRMGFEDFLGLMARVEQLDDDQDEDSALKSRMTEYWWQVFSNLDASNTGKVDKERLARQVSKMVNMSEQQMRQVFAPLSSAPTFPEFVDLMIDNEVIPVGTDVRNAFEHFARMRRGHNVELTEVLKRLDKAADVPNVDQEANQMLQFELHGLIAGDPHALFPFTEFLDLVYKHPGNFFLAADPNVLEVRQGFEEMFVSIDQVGNGLVTPAELALAFNLPTAKAMEMVQLGLKRKRGQAARLALGKEEFVELMTKGGVDLGPFKVEPQERELQRMFLALDADGTGAMSAADLVARLGFSGEEADRVFGVLGGKASQVDLHVFNRVMRSKTEEQTVKYRDLFLQLDTDGSGTVDIDELASALQMPKAEVAELIAEVDVNSDYELNMQEFINFGILVERRSSQKAREAQPSKGVPQEPETPRASIAGAAEHRARKASVPPVVVELPGARRGLGRGRGAAARGGGLARGAMQSAQRHAAPASLRAPAAVPAAGRQGAGRAVPRSTVRTAHAAAHARPVAHAAAPVSAPVAGVAKERAVEGKGEGEGGAGDVPALAKHTSKAIPDAVFQQYRELFEQADQDSNGLLSVHELAEVLGIPLARAHDLVARGDSDLNLVLNLPEFVRLVTDPSTPLDPPRLKDKGVLVVGNAPWVQASVGWDAAMEGARVTLIAPTRTAQNSMAAFLQTNKLVQLPEEMGIDIAFDHFSEPSLAALAGALGPVDHVVLAFFADGAGNSPVLGQQQPAAVLQKVTAHLGQLLAVANALVPLLSGNGCLTVLTSTLAQRCAAGGQGASAVAAAATRGLAQALITELRGKTRVNEVLVDLVGTVGNGEGEGGKGGNKEKPPPQQQQQPRWGSDGAASEELEMLDRIGESVVGLCVSAKSGQTVVLTRPKPAIKR